jgi:broad specificity phosphatase PhoE
MRIYFMRHGESEANLLHEFSNRGTKHGLTEKGRGQMAVQADKFVQVPIFRIFTSPLLRATESAEILRKVLRVPVVVTDALCEWDAGQLEGRRDEEAWRSYWQIRKDWLDGNHDSRIDGGESLADIERRFVPFVRALVAEEDPGGQFLLMGHGGLFCAALPALLGNVDRQFAESRGVDNASYIRADSIDGSLFCTDWCGIRFPRAGKFVHEGAPRKDKYVQ